MRRNAHKAGFRPGFSSPKPYSSMRHLACESDKEDQRHPGITGCHYADSQLIPVLDSTGLFLGQEGFGVSAQPSRHSAYTGRA